MVMTFVKNTYMFFACKGWELLDHWQTAAISITDEYYTRNGNEYHSLCSLIGTHIVELSNSESVTRDQTRFLLSG